MISFRSKFTGIAALAVATMSLTACFGTDSEAPTAPTINEFESANFAEATDTLKASTKIEFYGKVSDDVGLKSWSLIVLDKDMDTVYSAVVPTISGTSQSFDLVGKSSTNLSITNTGDWDLSGATAASYTVRLTVVNTNGLSTSKDMKIVAAKTPAIVTTPLTVWATALSAGGFDAKAGSFISATDGKVYTGTESKTKFATIDLVMTSTESGEATFFSTALGVTNGDLTGGEGATVNYWGTGRATLIAPVSKEPTTLEEVKAVTLTAQSATVRDGSYVLKTVEGTYYAMVVSGMTGAGDAATVTLKILK